MTTPTRTPARAVVEAFGDCAALAALYRDDVTWRLNRSLAPNIAGPHVGRAAVCGFNEAVFTKFYEPGSVSVEVLDELGDEASSVVRFNFRATSRRGHPYAVEYVLFAKTVDGKVSEVIELLDTHASNEQHQGNAVGVPPEA
ncbi:MAG: nuclear transport factor 2 family protein [Acidimicrobiales bacterium]|nr:nuclear transport factor 2 family protein [Acidimicrobiales bacterium]